LPDDRQEPSFESKLEELNQLIKQLEKGNLGIEDAIATFERGRALHKNLADQLAGFERRIEILTRGLDGQDRADRADDLDPVRKDDRTTPF
jgi:exodeoxyribonuclease VII small subunit